MQRHSETKAAKAWGRAAAVAAFALLACGYALPSRAERIKDLAEVAGVRTNQLVGYGLVVGLDGTGDQTTQTPFTTQSIENMLRQFGITLPAGTNMQLKNVAAVAVSAELPPFSKPGQTIDVVVSSIGNAQSLRGGALLMTPLKGADGSVYAVAQGNLVVSGFGGQGKDGSKITVNVQDVGRIPNGATVERAVPTAFATGNSLTLNLNSPDFTSAQRMVVAINNAFGPGVAQAIDATSVQVRAPLDASQRVAFVSTLENLTMDPGAAPARVIINSRTGTVVIGQHVRVMPAAVSHGNLVVTIAERPTVSQPGPLSGGTTTTVDRSSVEIQQDGKRMFLFKPGVTLEELVRAVNNVGAAPGDLVAILEALRSAGALRAELVVI
jgi:flagellar P-ring protein precursor FlgI